MTNEEGIIKALECFAVTKDFDETGCIGCAFETRGICLENCSDGLAKLALDLLNRLNADYEHLKNEHRETLTELIELCDIIEKQKADIEILNIQLNNAYEYIRLLRKQLNGR